MTKLIGILRDALSTLYQREPARVVAYGGVILVAAASIVAGRLGITLPVGVTQALSVIGVFVATEVIRSLVTPVTAPNV